ncbi:MAG: hypothetical protein HY807_02610 [Nitrospirae bacterium]|nr:hypothetical protein [Nitrospirota bacterium]
MKQHLRKQALIKKTETFIPEPTDIFSEEAIRHAFEEKERSSEHRFDLLASPVAVQTVFKATQDFKSRRSLEVTATKRPEEIPDIPQGTRFQFSRLCGHYGSLKASSNRIKNREDLIVVLVWEEGLLVGYGIAASKNDECEIEIVDVDYYSRRKADLVDTLQLSDQSFQVGVGHVVVNALIKECPRPIHVDATNSSARYIFKSLGFVNEDKSSNLFILKID